MISHSNLRQNRLISMLYIYNRQHFYRHIKISYNHPHLQTPLAIVYVSICTVYIVLLGSLKVSLTPTEIVSNLAIVLAFRNPVTETKI